MATSIEPVKSRFGKGEILAVAAAFAYATDNLLLSTSLSSAQLDPVLGVTIRSIPLLIFSLLMSFGAKKRDPNVGSLFSSWKIVGSVITYGILTFLVGTILLFHSFRLGGVMITTPLLGTNVLWSAILAIFILHEKINTKVLAGILISIAGVFLLRFGQGSNTGLPPTWVSAVPLALLTAFSWAIGGVLIAYATRKNIDMYQSLAFSMSVSLVLLNGFLLLTGQISGYASIDGITILKTIAAGVFNAIALVCLVASMKFTTIASSGTLASMQVAIAPVMAALLLNQNFTLLYGLAILLILVGVVLVQVGKEAPRIEEAEPTQPGS